jgi:CBS domain containing-hemolysin-like protein
MEPDQRSVAAGLLAVLLLVLANAFFVAAEFALVGARRTRLDEMARTGDGKARLARRAVQSLDRYISATQLGITLASLGLGWIGEPALAHVVDGAFSWLPAGLATFATHTVAVAIAFTIITVLHIILGELVPKAMALLYPEQVAGWVVLPLMAFSWIMAPAIWVLNGTANWLLKVAGIRTPGDHERLHSPEEIRILVEQSQEAGSLHRDDARLLEGVFEFSEKTAEEVMTPRTEIIALEADLTMAEAADRVVEAHRSRYPVFTDSLDEIVGVVLAKDILSALRKEPLAPVRSIMRPPLFVPGTREVEDVLADMKRLKTHLAVVLDEYGGTAGLVTMEDLLEEIVGPIFDEHDQPDLPAADAGTTVLDGGLPITQFNTEFDASLDDTDYTTIGGVIFGQLGRLPRPGDAVQLGGFTFEVVSMAGRRVETVRLVRPSPPAGTPAAVKGARAAPSPGDAT